MGFLFCDKLLFAGMTRCKCVTNAGEKTYTVGGHSVTKRWSIRHKTIPSGTQWRNDNRLPKHELSAGTAGKQQFIAIMTLYLGAVGWMGMGFRHFLEKSVRESGNHGKIFGETAKIEIKNLSALLQKQHNWYIIETIK